MANIEQPKFSHNDAMQLIGKMRIIYGKKFSDQWSGIKPSELATEMVDLFSDLTIAQVAKGCEKMKTQIWCPSLPEFREWCIGDLRSQWLGAHEAWSIAIGSIDFNGNEMTVVWTKECAIAFDAVSNMVKLGDKYQIAEAKKIFVERYERMVSESLERGEKPVYEVSYGVDKEQRKIALREAEIAGLLPSGTSTQLIEHVQSPQDAVNEEKRFKTLAQKHLAEIQKILKVNKPKEELTPIHIEIEAKSFSQRMDGWFDPFDETEQYKKVLANEKKPVPVVLQEWEKRSK